MEYKVIRNRIDAYTARKLSLEACCDPRTIVKVLKAVDVRGGAGERAKVVLDRYGYIKLNYGQG